jgi:hypothetical protein
MRKIHLFMEGNKIAATWDNFDCLATSPAGFGDNISGAVKDLITNSSVIEVNDIITSIENEPFKERASESAELAATATNTQSTPIITTGCRGCINRGTVCDSCEDFSYLEVT